MSHQYVVSFSGGIGIEADSPLEAALEASKITGRMGYSYIVTELQEDKGYVTVGRFDAVGNSREGSKEVQLQK